MLIVFLAAAFITALLNAFLFGGSFIMSIAVAAIAAVGILLSLIKAIGAPLRGIIRIAALAAVIAVCLFAPPKAEEGGFIKTQNTIAKALDKAIDGDGYAADALLDEIKNGIDIPAVVLIRARAAYEKGEYQKAADTVNTLTGAARHLPDYYIVAAASNLDAGNDDRAENLLTEAAQLYPEWFQVQYYAGAVALQNNRLEKGTYFLARALDLCEDDNEYVLEMLGTGYYRLGDYETAKEYLDMGLAAATDPDTISSINAMLSDISAKEAGK
ncbi:MAG: hypothetical protein IKX96_01365 [Firmicutes bacterium]|nr:hypothetical protein [Bacillota bacterium]